MKKEQINILLCFKLFLTEKVVWQLKEWQLSVNVQNHGQSPQDYEKQWSDCYPFACHHLELFKFMNNDTVYSVITIWYYIT